MAVTVFTFGKEVGEMARGADRKRRGAAEWQALVKLQEASGLSRVAFCQQEGIGRASFDQWRRRLATRSVGGQFVELAVPREGGGDWEVELTLPAGMVLRLRG